MKTKLLLRAGLADTGPGTRRHGMLVSANCAIIDLPVNGIITLTGGELVRKEIRV
jgi:hypothetical protein